MLLLYFMGNVIAKATGTELEGPGTDATWSNGELCSGGSCVLGPHLVATGYMTVCMAVTDGTLETKVGGKGTKTFFFFFALLPLFYFIFY